MSMWDPHSLAETTEQLVLRLRQRVRSKVDLPEVPAGTTGTVIQINGFVWLRYRVRFENGEEISHLDGRQIEPA